jgi:UDP-N-acetylmuramoyl-tripeptide--D-alanyl-D-alanine ligase
LIALPLDRSEGPLDRAKTRPDPADSGVDRPLDHARRNVAPAAGRLDPRGRDALGLSAMRLAMEFTAQEIASIVGGRLVGPSTLGFTEVAIDSRRVRPGALFVALPGARTDGHEFIDAALARGAAGALVTRDAPVSIRGDAAFIRCEDATAALQRLAATWRARLRGTVIGVAGSNGKTTTKETLAKVLEGSGSTVATPGNENSQVGAPVALLSAPLEAAFVVLELGTSQPGELSRLAAMARPDHAVVTAAFAEHLEWLRDVDGVVAAETEILEFVPPGGLALIGSAEPRLVEEARRHGHLRLRSVGSSAADDWRLSAIRLGRDGTRFHLAGEGGARDWHVPLLGPPAAWAAAFAIALARSFGSADESIQAGLAKLAPAAHRLTAIPHPHRPWLVIDDCYNSNPASCVAAIETAAELRGEGERLILVLGDMLELGDATREAHREVGRAVPEHAPETELLLTVGPAAREIAAIASERGVRARPVEDADAAIAALQALLEDGRSTTILVKASRGVGLDRLVAALSAGS